MKKIVIILIIMGSISLFSLSTKASKQELPFLGKIIVIDPGHGGKDPGTSSNNILEKNINLEISKKLKQRLLRLGATVLMTRNGDYDLSYPNASLRKKSDFDNRIKIINESKSHLYLSIHLNYLVQKQYYGPQVFYDTNFKNNYRIAQIMQKKLNLKLKTNRKTKNIPTSTYMYDKLDSPGLLIECGFLSNPEERERLNNNKYQQYLANTISDGVVASISFF